MTTSSMARRLDLPERLRHREEMRVVVDSHIDRAVVREHQPLWPTLGAAAVEIGLVIEASAVRQGAAEIAECIAAHHMVRPGRAEAAPMPATRLARILSAVP